MTCSKRNNSGLYLCLLVIILTLSCPFTHGGNGDRLLNETFPDFWKTNLVATVIGYTGQRMLHGVQVPEMDPAGRTARSVWLYSVAPTNYAGITFSIHACGLWSLTSVYPTNQLFIFPALLCAKKVSTSVMLSGEYNDPIIPHHTVEDYCPYRTYEKWFPISDSQVQYWISDLTEKIENHQETVANLRTELEKASNDKERNRISQKTKRMEEWISDNQNTIEKCQKQPQYFQARKNWLKTQGLEP